MYYPQLSLYLPDIEYQQKKYTMKKIILPLSAIILLLVLIVCLLPLFFKGSVRQWAEHQISAQGNVKLEIGSMHAGLLKHFPHLHVTVKNAIVTDQAADTLASFPRAEATFQLTSLFGKKTVKVYHLTLEDARLQAEIDTAGHSVWKFLPFSSDPTSVAEHGAAFARGMRDARIVCCYKHFPGHGSAKGDTHNGSADISASWSERELEPFKALLAENMPAMVMVAHVTLRQMDDRPASLSQVVISGLLRHKLGFQGVVITDDLDMEAVAARYSLKERIRLAVEAGADILLFGNNLHYEEDLPFRVHDTLMELIEEGSISPERIRESYIRIRALKDFIAVDGGR